MQYIVAKANQTALAFVAKADKEQNHWIIIARTSSYSEAQAIAARNNGGKR